jgi:hypothetical protein
MHTEKFIHPKNVYLITRNTLILKRSSILVILAAMGGVLVLLSFLDAYGNLSAHFHRNLYLLIFFTMGLFLTGRTFTELHDPVKGYAWLLLPASNLDKTVSRVLLASVIYWIGSLLFYLLCALVSEGLNTVVLDRRHLLFNPLDPVLLYGALTFFSIQAPFLIGAVYFKKHALSKTVLALFGTLFFLGICIAAATWLILGGQVSGMDVRNLFYSWEHEGLTPRGQALMVVVKVFFWLVVPAVSWVVCFYRHKETEL